MKLFLFDRGARLGGNLTQHIEPAAGVEARPGRQVRFGQSGIVGFGNHIQCRDDGSEIGVRFGSDLAASAGVVPAPDVRTGLERVCEALRGVGFQARVEDVEEGRAEIVTPTCPLRPLVVANPADAEVRLKSYLNHKLK